MLRFSRPDPTSARARARPTLRSFTPASTPRPGSLEARLVARGYALLREYAPSVGISIEEVGAVLVAWDDEQAASLPKLAAKAAANGYMHTEIIDRDAVYEIEPHLGTGATGGDDRSRRAHHRPVVDTAGLCVRGDGKRSHRPRRTTTLPCATVDDDVTTITTTRGQRIRTRFLVNAAGLRGDELHRNLGLDGFTIRPRRGELIVFDKLARSAPQRNSAARADLAHQGRACGPNRVRQRDARTDRRGRRRQDCDRLDPRPVSTACWRKAGEFCLS